MKLGTQRWERIRSKSDEFPLAGHTPFLSQVMPPRCLVTIPSHPSLALGRKLDLVNPSVSWSVISGRPLIIVLDLVQEDPNVI